MPQFLRLRASRGLTGLLDSDPNVEGDWRRFPRQSAGKMWR